jgi:integrase
MAVYKADKPLKNGNMWIFFTRYTDLSGKRKAYKSKKYATKKEAQEAERLFLQSLDYETVSKDMTFRELYQHYYDYQKDKVKQTTIKTYKDRIKYLDILGDIKLVDLNINHIEQWKKKMYEYDISNSYRNMNYKLLKAILNYGSKWYNFNFNSVYNKMTNFTDPNEIKKEMQFYTFEEFKKFISVEDDLKFRCIFKTFYYCGLRKGELRGLAWRDLNLEDGILNVRQNVVSNHVTGVKYIVSSPKTKKSARTIPIPKHLVKELKEYKESCKKIYGFNEDYFVFGHSDPINNDPIYKRNKRNSELANLKKIRIHDFRHSCASLLINNNASITLVANYLGHTKIDETLNTYSHMYKNSLNSLMDILNKLEED